MTRDIWEKLVNYIESMKNNEVLGMCPDGHRSSGGAGTPRRRLIAVSAGEIVP